MNKIIGVDLDGVVTDVVRVIIDYLRDTGRGEFYPGDFITYNTENWASVTKEEMGKLFSTPEVYTNMPFIRDAQSGLRTLKFLGYSLYAITSRPTVVEDATNKWIKDNNLPFEKVIFTTHSDKKLECINNHVDYFIEDRLETCLDLAEVCKKVFVFDSRYNRSKSLPKNIIRVFAWTDVITNFLGELWFNDK